MIVYGVVSIRGQASFSRAIHPRRDGVFHQAPKLKTRFVPPQEWDAAYALCRGSGTVLLSRCGTRASHI